ncbi:uncharacterized protein LOC144151569 [Haemaphysalis longicornis]
MCSQGAAIAAQSSRGNRMEVSDKEEYQIILPSLPTGRIVSNTVFLHGDVRARPFRVEDFRDMLAKCGMLSEVVALGAYQINHIWAVTFNSPEATKRMAAAGEVQVKGRRCLVIDPQHQEVKLKLHWLLYGVSDDDIRAAFAAFGKVTEITKERWRVQGVSDEGSTTRTVLLKLKSGLKVDDLPHQIRVAGELALFVAPGRPMQCLRCHTAGHVRRDCKVPRCSICRRFGHEDAQCVKTYAKVTGAAGSDDASDLLMDTAEAEEAAEGAGEALSPEVAPASLEPSDQGSQDSNHGGQPTMEFPPLPDAQGKGDEYGDDHFEEDAPEGMEEGDQQRTNSVSSASIVNATAKRSREETGHKQEAEGGSVNGEPPQKAAVVRRSTLRQRPGVQPGRKPPDTTPGQPQPPGGPIADGHT